MKAAPEAQLRLLDLQELDTALDRLAHRRRGLPELAQIARHESRTAELRDAVIAAETEVSDLEREQKKAEQDVEQVRTRAERDQKRLDSGQVSSARDLENLTSELTSLHRRQGDLEDVVLEIMERKEAADERLAASLREREAAQAEVADLTGRKEAAEKEIDQEIAVTGQARAAVIKDIPADLLTLYDKLRDQFSGIGAAALHRGQCQGCHLALNTVDLNTIRAAAPDEIVRCEECRRILVRTAESGL